MTEPKGKPVRDKPAKRQEQTRKLPDEHPIGDAELAEEAARDPKIDRSKTPGRTFDV